MSGDFQNGTNEFNFSNGDKYVGDYCAHISGLAWREGQGSYITHDGQIYDGNWKDDKLNEAENVQIQFRNEDQYVGKISKYKYNGPGSYLFKNRGVLTCNFQHNKPSGDIIFVDRNDQIWYGKADTDCAVLTREHIFSFELDHERGKGKPKLASQTEITEAPEIEQPPNLKEMEQIVFAKSFKVPNEIDFGEKTEWLKDFEAFEEKKKIVYNKIVTDGVQSLTNEEKTWYRQCYKSAKLVQNRKQKKAAKQHRPQLLKSYLEEEMRNTCRPPTVFM